MGLDRGRIASASEGNMKGELGLVSPCARACMMYVPPGPNRKRNKKPLAKVQVARQFLSP